MAGRGHDHDAGRKKRRIVPVRMTSKVSIHFTFSERASANQGESVAVQPKCC
jgi:hypothetical protein